MENVLVEGGWQKMLVRRVGTAKDELDLAICWGHLARSRKNGRHYRPAHDQRDDH